MTQYHGQRHMFIIQNAAFRHPHSFFPLHHSPAPNLPPSHPPHTIEPHRPKPSQDIPPATESGSNRHLDLDTTTHPTFPEPNRRPRTPYLFPPPPPPPHLHREPNPNHVSHDDDDKIHHVSQIYASISNPRSPNAETTTTHANLFFNQSIRSINKRALICNLHNM